MIWNALQYGWGVNWWLTIGGIDCAWSEASYNGTLPAGFSHGLRALEIGKSAEVGQAVDRDTGMGQGLPLTFSLLSQYGAAAWMQAPTATTVLTANCIKTDGTLTVKDTSAFPAASYGAPVTIYIGLEAITYTGKTSTTFTGCGRGCFGSLATAHFYGTQGGTVTDKPRVWRGREIRLYAAPVSPDGHTTGAVLTDESLEVWRGFIDQGPYRDKADKFTIEALALDRILTNPLPAGLTGTVLGLDARAPIDPASYLHVAVNAYDNSSPTPLVVTGYPWEVLITPFAGLAPGTLLSLAEQKDLIHTAWTQALIDVGAPAVLLQWHDTGTVDPSADIGGFHSTAVFVYPANSAIYKTILTVNVNGHLKRDQFPQWWTGGLGAYVGGNPETFGINWVTGLRLLPPSNVNFDYVDFPYTLKVSLDSAADAVPAYGTVKIGDVELLYKSSVTVGNVAYLNGLSPVSNTTGYDWVPPNDTVTQKASIQFSRTGLAPDVILHLLQSSGGLMGGGYWDSWGYGEGYGLPDSAVDQTSMSVLLGGIESDLNLRVGGSAVSLQDMMSGMLALTQRGLVARPDSSGSVRLGVVSTNVNGSWYKTKITDDHLLAFNGDPITAIRKRDPVTQIKVALTTDAAGKGGSQPYTMQETAGVLESGGQTLDLTLSLDGAQAHADSLIKIWGAAILAQTHSVQTVEVRVVPWLDVVTGDLCRLETTHPALWNWATATEGYTGQARCMGARRDLGQGALILTLLIQGGPTVAGISPAAQIAWFDSGSAPTLVNIEARFNAYMQQAITENAGNPIVLTHYMPGYGTEASGGYLTVSAAALVNVSGTDYCQLTISSHAGLSGSLSTSQRSTLTLPAGGFAGCTDWQRMFAHADDGTFWG